MSVGSRGSPGDAARCCFLSACLLIVVVARGPVVGEAVEREHPARLELRACRVRGSGAESGLYVHGAGSALALDRCDVRACADGVWVQGAARASASRSRLVANCESATLSLIHI